MKQLPDKVRRAYVFTWGDPSVGIGWESAVVEGDGDFLVDLSAMDQDVAREMLEDFRAKLVQAFAEIWDEPAHVRFDFEEPGDD